MGIVTAHTKCMTFALILTVNKDVLNAFIFFKFSMVQCLLITAYLLKVLVYPILILLRDVFWSVIFFTNILV
jgi:hypothetical protein